MTAIPDKPVAPSPDTQGSRRPFAELQEPLQPRSTENDRAYCAFLLHCMQAERSMRKIATAMKISDGTVRYWRKKHAWERRRVSTQNCDWEALRAYRMLMDLQTGSVQVAALRVALDVVLDDTGFAHLRHSVAAQRQGVEAGPEDHAVNPMEKPNTPQTEDQSAVTAFKSPLSDDELQELDIQAHYKRLREQVVTQHLRPDDIKRQIQLIDGTLGLIARKVSTGELEVKVSDIPSLLKARAMLTGLPTEHVAVQAQHHHEHSVVLESTRIRDARQQGEPALLQAIQEEIHELQVIVDAVPRNVIEVHSE